MAALGCLPASLVVMANDRIAERTAANQVATAPAATRGQLPRAQRDVPEGRGVQRSRSNPYTLRATAKAFDNRIERQKDLWRSGRYWEAMSWREWNALLEAQEHAWAIADEASNAAGHAHKDRHGRWCCTGPRGFISVVLRHWCEEARVDYC